MGFVQIIEFKTSNVDEVRKLGDEFRAATEGKRTATRMTLCEDRDRPGTYVQMVEFPSYEEAMKNSSMPETQEISQKMQNLAGGSATFRNLDVIEMRDL
jgi:quinol monooxygenase YgiN